VYVVAIAELNEAIETEAVALASDLGLTVYEARLLLAPGIPAVVLRTFDKPKALDLLGRLRTRGHGAIACEAAAVVPSHDMTLMRRFRLGQDGISLDDVPGAHLPYNDALVLVAAVHRRRTANEGEAHDRKLSVARAVLSGGLVMTRTVKRETHAAEDEREPVLYLFRRSGGAPWILRENGTHWVGLGRPVAPSAADNFRTTQQVLRERMPGAFYDDRLVARRFATERLAVSGGSTGTTVTTSSEGGIDLLAHLLALWIARSFPFETLTAHRTSEGSP
jgi:hypothetical protein